jgi:flagellar assembly factor FliW
MRPDLEAETADEQVITFFDGIPGFPDSQRFVLVSISPDSEFQLLQSLDEPEVSMVVTVPWAFFPDYDLELEESDRRDLALESAEEAVVFCPVTLEAATRRAFVNLMGPFVVNSRTRSARQVVLSGSDLPLRAAVELGGA